MRDDRERVAELVSRRFSGEWQERYEALEQARNLSPAARAKVAAAYSDDENVWVRSLAQQFAERLVIPARRSRRGIVREVDQILHGARLTFEQRWKLIRLFEEAEESGSTSHLGLAVDRASRLVTAALSEPGQAHRYLGQLDAFLRHVAMFVRPVPVATTTAPARDVVAKVLRMFDLESSVDILAEGRVRSDALNRALSEVMQNAVDAGSRQVRVEGNNHDGHFILSIRNDGPNLTASDEDALFTPWFTTRVGHAGLGLFLARAAITEVGGSMSLSSTGPVTFEISLPR